MFTGGAIIGISKGQGEGASRGKILVVTGLFIQLIFFGFFVAIAVHWHRKIQRWPNPVSLDPKTKWKLHMTVLYVASALITVRSIVRITEFGLGTRGYLWVHEWPLYAFDTVLMFLVMVLFNWVNPSQIQSADNGESRQWIQLGHLSNTALVREEDRST